MLDKLVSQKLPVARCYGTYVMNGNKESSQRIVIGAYFCTPDLCFFWLSKLPHAPDFCYFFGVLCTILRKQGRRPGGYVMWVKTIDWPWLGRSLMQAQPLFVMIK